MCLEREALPAAAVCRPKLHDLLRLLFQGAQQDGAVGTAQREYAQQLSEAAAPSIAKLHGVKV